MAQPEASTKSSFNDVTELHAKRLRRRSTPIPLLNNPCRLQRKQSRTLLMRKSMRGRCSERRFRSSVRRIFALLLLLCGPALLVLVIGHAGLRLNATPSVPTGLYWITSSPNAEFVEFCPPEPFASLSIERRYRVRSFLGCPDGGVPLL